MELHAICEFCGRHFDYEIKSIKPRKYCSMECKDKVTRTNKKCVVCGNEYNALNYLDSKYCSEECRESNYTIKNFNLTRKEYNERVNKGCDICGFRGLVHLHHINGKEDNSKLIPLCLNHHYILHRQHKTIEDMRKDYENDRIR